MGITGNSDNLHVGDNVRVVPETGEVDQIVTTESKDGEKVVTVTKVHVVYSSDKKAEWYTLGNGVKLEKMAQTTPKAAKA